MQSRVSDVFVKSASTGCASSCTILYKIVQLEWLYGMQSRVNDVFVKSASTGCASSCMVCNHESVTCLSKVRQPALILEHLYFLCKIFWTSPMKQARPITICSTWVSSWKIPMA